MQRKMNEAEISDTNKKHGFDWLKTEVFYKLKILNSKYYE